MSEDTMSHMSVEDITVRADEPMFMFRNLRVEYNVGGEHAAYALRVPKNPSEDVQTELFGILTLLGFSRESARVELCHFEVNTSLPVGTMRLAPLSRTSLTHESLKGAAERGDSQ